MTGMKSTNRRTLDLVYIALFAVLTAVCSWISIPAVVPFTLQTFAVFCAVGLLGGKRGTLSIVVYIFLGIAGMPVFAGFTGGVGALFGAAGGYLLGFVFIGLIYWLITGLFGTKPLVSVVAMILGLLACYASGRYGLWLHTRGKPAPSALRPRLGGAFSRLSSRISRKWALPSS